LAFQFQRLVHQLVAVAVSQKQIALRDPGVRSGLFGSLAKAVSNSLKLNTFSAACRQLADELARWLAVALLNSALLTLQYFVSAASVSRPSP